MMDWVTLAALIAIIGTLFGVIVPMIRNIERNLGARIDSVERNLGARIDKVESRLDKVETRIDRLDRKIDSIDAKYDKKIDEIHWENFALARGMNPHTEFSQRRPRYENRRTPVAG